MKYLKNKDYDEWSLSTESNILNLLVSITQLNGYYQPPILDFSFILENRIDFMHEIVGQK